MESLTTNRNSSFSYYKLTHLAKTKNLTLLAELGGVQGIISSLNSNAELGILGDGADLRRRPNNAFRKSRFISSTLRVLLCDAKDYVYLVGCACSIYFMIAGINLDFPKERLKEGLTALTFLVVYSVLENSIDLGFEFCLWKVKEQTDSVVVLRNGLKQLIPSSEIHVGDVVFVKSGAKIPADGLLLDGDETLRFDASNLTAATTVMEVDSSNPFLSGGAILVEGCAKMLIISVGKNIDFFGKYDGLVMTQLEKKVESVGRYLQKATWIFPVSFLVVTLARCFSGNSKYGDGSRVFDPKNTTNLEASYLVAEIIYAAVIIEVALGTTFFYWAMKVSLYRALSEFFRCNIIIRNLLALERIGLGDATVNVRVEQSTLQASEFLSVPEIVENIEAPFTISASVVDLVQQGIYLNTTAIAYRVRSTGKYQFSGSPSERAILSREYLKLGANWETLNETCTVKKVYSSEVLGRRILVQVNDTFHLHRRGDAEVILKMCSSFYDASGIIRCLNENERNLLARKLESMNRGGNANIALAHRLVSEEEFITDPDLKENENCYILLGFILLKELDKEEMSTRVEEGFPDAGLRLEETSTSANRAVEIVTLESKQGHMVARKDSRLINEACEDEETTENHTLVNILVEDPGYESVHQPVVAKFCLVEELTGNENPNTTISPVVLELLKPRVGLNKTNKVISCVEFAESPIGNAITSWAVQELNLDHELSVYKSEKLNLEEYQDQGLGFLVSLEDGAFLVHQKGCAENILKICSSYYRATREQQVLGDQERMLLEQKVKEWESSQCCWAAFVHSQDENRGLWSLLGILILDQEKTEVAVDEDLVSIEDACPVVEISVSTQNGDAEDSEQSDSGVLLKQINAENSAAVEDEIEMSSEAPVLVSMGIEDDTTRKSSDIVILDGNYSCLPWILGWSCCILHNSQMFLQYQITATITSMVFTFTNYLSLPGIVGEETNLMNDIVQLIWVNLGMGLIVAVAFGRQKPRIPYAEQRKSPMAYNEWQLINGFMVRNIVAQVAYQTIIMSILQFRGTNILGFNNKKMNTITTFTPAFLQTFNMVNARKVEEKNIFSGIQIWFVCLTVMLIALPIFAAALLLNITRLSIVEWMLCIGIGMGTWPVCFGFKFVQILDGWFPN